MVAGTLACACSAMVRPETDATAAPGPVAQPIIDKVAAGAAGGRTLPADPGLQTAIDAAVAEAARRTGLDPRALKIISAETVIWPDGSLGCPEPGVVYTMAPVPGYRIRIEVTGRVLDYHAARRGDPLFCPQGRSTDAHPGAKR